jgi:hypothetical protein
MSMLSLLELMELILIARKQGHGKIVKIIQCTIELSKAMQIGKVTIVSKIKRGAILDDPWMVLKRKLTIYD